MRKKIAKINKLQRDLDDTHKHLEDYKFALDASCILSVVDTNGIIQHANDNFCKISKFREEELVGKSHQIINSGYHTKEFFRGLWTTIKKGEIWKGEVRNKAKDGTYYWLDTTIIPLMKNGKPYKYLGIRSDITKRVQALEELKKSEEIYRLLYENSLVSIVTTNMKTLKPITANDVAVQLFGYKSKADFLANYDSKFHIINTSKRAENLRMFMQEGELRNKVQEMRRLDGTRRWIKLFSKVNSQNMAETVFVDVTSEIEAREKLELKLQELEVANKELESFNYVASHDLQEPLRKIKNFTRVLLNTEEKELTEQGQHYLRRISSVSDQMQSLLEDLLTYSRTIKAERQFEKVDLKALLNEVIANLNESINQKKPVIKCKKICEANVIHFQFQQLLNNLISNSVKFAHPERPCVISIKSEINLGSKLKNQKLSSQKKYCHLIYEDNGIGFESKYNERIFEIFERLHEKEKYPGTGIGLAICRRIMENHNGIITASGELNKGTRFDIYWPQSN